MQGMCRFCNPCQLSLGNYEEMQIEGRCHLRSSRAAQGDLKSTMSIGSHSLANTIQYHSAANIKQGNYLFFVLFYDPV